LSGSHNQAPGSAGGIDSTFPIHGAVLRFVPRVFFLRKKILGILLLLYSNWKKARALPVSQRQI